MNLRSTPKQDLQVIPDMIKQRAELIAQKSKTEKEIVKYNDKILKELSEKLSELGKKYSCPCRVRVESENTFLEFNIQLDRHEKYFMSGKVELPMKWLGDLQSNSDMKKYLREVEKNIKRIKVLFKGGKVLGEMLSPRCYLNLNNRYSAI